MFFLDFTWFFLYDHCPAVSVSWSCIKCDWVCPNQSRVFIRESVFVILYSLERADCTTLQLIHESISVQMGLYDILVFWSARPLGELFPCHNSFYIIKRKKIRNESRKFSFLVCFLRSNGGVSRRRSATAEFRYSLYGRSTAPSFGDAISPFPRPSTAAAAAAPTADPFPPLVVLSPPVAMVANHCRLKYLIFGGDPLI